MGNGTEYGMTKDEWRAKEDRERRGKNKVSALMSASQIVSAVVSRENSGNIAEQTLEIARKFEGWLNEENSNGK